MAERLDFSALWPVPAGRFGWTARGNAPCVMEIVSWLTAGTIDTAWPGVSPAIAEYVQAAQDAMDDEARQKLLVLVPGLIGCVGKGDPPEIESARRLLLAQRSLSQLVPLVLEAVGWPQEAAAVRASGGSSARIRGPLHEAAEYAPTNPLVAAVRLLRDRDRWFESISRVHCEPNFRGRIPSVLSRRYPRRST
jgi:hypothetical protein